MTAVTVSVWVDAFVGSHFVKIRLQPRFGGILEVCVLVGFHVNLRYVPQYVPTCSHNKTLVPRLTNSCRQRQRFFLAAAKEVLE